MTATTIAPTTTRHMATSLGPPPGMIRWPAVGGRLAPRTGDYPCRVRTWILYSVIRIGIFAAAFVLLFWLLGGEFWWLAAICAAIIALCISYIFLGAMRQRISIDLAARTSRRKKPVDIDAAVEDAAVDGVVPPADRPS